jgi:hypothetical protein
VVSQHHPGGGRITFGRFGRHCPKKCKFLETNKLSLIPFYLFSFFPSFYLSYFHLCTLLLTFHFAYATFSRVHKTNQNIKYKNSYFVGQFFSQLKTKNSRCGRGMMFVAELYRMQLRKLD